MHPRNGVFPPDAVHIADGDDLHAGDAQEVLQMITAHHADADEAEIDAAVGPMPLPIRGMNPRVENKRRRHANSGRFQEATAVEAGGDIHRIHLR
jgi:hypothetical protein